MDSYELCEVCDSPTIHACDVCELVFYCGAECQRQHWAMHEAECVPIEYNLKHFPEEMYELGNLHFLKSEAEEVGALFGRRRGKLSDKATIRKLKREKKRQKRKFKRAARRKKTVGLVRKQGRTAQAKRAKSKALKKQKRKSKWRRRWDRWREKRQRKREEKRAYREGYGDAADYATRNY